MKKLSAKKIKEQLEELQADPATTELVLSTVEQYNDLVADYNNGEKHQQYLCYQVRQQIFKMQMDLKKLNAKQKDSGSGEPDKLTELLKNIKGKKEMRN